MIKLDDRIRIKVKSDCMQCKHYNHDFTCSAYPKGIPEKLLMNKEKHRTVRKDQTGNAIFESILKGN